MIYKESRPYESDQISIVLDSKDTDAISEMLLYYSMNAVDYGAAVFILSKCLSSNIQELHRISIVCIGHIARIYKKTPVELAANAFKEFLSSNNSHLGESVHNALEDISIFDQKSYKAIQASLLLSHPPSDRQNP